ncbi:hydroxymethylbilane synthase [Mycobacteroides abscessus subsp. abscessus]|nr:hydroxymethylbilane synthase [Mycobacteroides abscessus subsp. abscessus]
MVLAAAGLSRAGRSQYVTEFLDPSVMLSAAAQGALAVECRSDDLDSVAARLATGLDDPLTRACRSAPTPRCVSTGSWPGPLRVGPGPDRP